MVQFQTQKAFYKELLDTYNEAATFIMRQEKVRNDLENNSKNLRILYLRFLI